MWELDHKKRHQRIDAFKLWCWKRLLRVAWTARRSNQSILKEPILNILWKYWCWSWGPNTLATWCTAPTHWKRPWCWERLKAGGEGDDRGWDGWKALPTLWTWVWASSRRWLKDRKAWRAAVHGVTKSQTWMSDWITTIYTHTHTHTHIYSGSLWVKHYHCFTKVDIFDSLSNVKFHHIHLLINFNIRDKQL